MEASAHSVITPTLVIEAPVRLSDRKLFKYFLIYKKALIPFSLYHLFIYLMLSCYQCFGGILVLK